jgi:hypothetical protein
MCLKLSRRTAAVVKLLVAGRIRPCVARLKVHVHRQLCPWWVMAAGGARDEAGTTSVTVFGRSSVQSKRCTKLLSAAAWLSLWQTANSLSKAKGSVEGRARATLHVPVVYCCVGE